MCKKPNIVADCLTPILCVRDFEEMALHSFERVSGGGMASPHTERTLAFIDELKTRHGIDYDTHATYRFVERQNPPPTAFPNSGGSNAVT